MISGGDESARNAFRAYLRDESSQRGLVTTEEMTAADVLEVKNLADAIARAEEAMRAPRSSKRDMFAELAAATDDASGPAVFAAARPTPVPPPPPAVVTAAAAPAAAPPAPITQPLLLVPNEEDAFLQPAGRMRSFADETLDGYRPLATLELRIRARRHTASWVVGGVLAVLAVLVVVALVVGRATKEPVAPAPVALAPPPAVVTTTTATPKAAEPTVAPAMPVMDVRSLPPAK